MEDLVQEYLDNKKGVEAAMRVYVSDTSVPLEDRWALYEKSGLGEVVVITEQAEAMLRKAPDLKEQILRDFVRLVVVEK